MDQTNKNCIPLTHGLNRPVAVVTRNSSGGGVLYMEAQMATAYRAITTYIVIAPTGEIQVIPRTIDQATRVYCGEWISDYMRNVKAEQFNGGTYRRLNDSPEFVDRYNILSQAWN